MKSIQKNRFELEEGEIIITPDHPVAKEVEVYLYGEKVSFVTGVVFYPFIVVESGKVFP